MMQLESKFTFVASSYVVVERYLLSTIPETSMWQVFQMLKSIVELACFCMGDSLFPAFLNIIWTQTIMMSLFIEGLSWLYLATIDEFPEVLQHDSWASRTSLHGQIDSMLCQCVSGHLSYDVYSQAQRKRRHPSSSPSSHPN